MAIIARRWRGRFWRHWARNTRCWNAAGRWWPRRSTARKRRFNATLERGLSEYEKAARGASGGALSGETAFNLFESFGFPLALDQTLAEGALAVFGDKYGEPVKVYRVGDFSTEVCGGPHADRRGELGRFRITKDEAVGQGVRRIRATLEEAISSK